MLKYPAYALLSLFIITNLVLGCFGISSILLTTVVYGLLICIPLYIFSRLSRAQALGKNLCLSFIVFFSCLYTGELLLRYVFRVGLQKHELQGNFFYSLPYGTHGINYVLRKYVLKAEYPELTNYPAHHHEIQEKEEFSYLHQYNSLGLRGAEPDTSTDLFNVITLGDSYTEGSGTPGDSTWTALLQEILKVNNKAGANVQCINGGICGGDVISEYHIFNRLLLPLKPKLVVLSLNSTDITDIIKNGGTPDSYVTDKRVPWWGYIYQFSYITRAFMHGAYKTNWLLLTPDEYENEKRRAMDKIFLCIRNEYLKLSTRHSFRLLVVLHPMQPELEKGEFPLQPLAAKLASQKDLHVIDLYDKLKKMEGEGVDYASLYWPKDGHYKSTGYLFFATILAQEIEAKQLYEGAKYAMETE